MTRIGIRSLFLMVLIVTTSVIASDSKKDFLAARYQQGREARTSAVGDTLFQGFFNCDLVVYVSTTAGGYVAGNNGFGDLEKVQKYEDTGGGSINEMVILFAAKNVGADGDLIGKIYDVNSTTGEPENVLGTSTISVSDVDTTGGLTSFVFDPAVPVGDAFFLGIEMSQSSGDSVGIWTTVDGCLAGSNTSSNAWEKFSDGTWVPFDDTISWGLVVDMGIFPVLDTPTSVKGEPQIVEGHQLMQNYPNPFNPTTRIAFQLATNTTVALRVYDLLGQVVATVIDDENYSAGTHILDFDGSRLSNGVYYYRLETGDFTATRKMTILK